MYKIVIFQTNVGHNICPMTIHTEKSMSTGVLYFRVTCIYFNHSLYAALHFYPNTFQMVYCTFYTTMLA